MQIATVEEIVSRIKEAARRADEQPILASDADGTLWSGDVGVDVYESMIERAVVRQDVLAALQLEAQAAGLPPSEDPLRIAAELVKACERGTYSEPRSYEMMAWLFGGWTRQEVRAFVREVFLEKQLAAREHPELRAVLERLRDSKLPLFVVSASPQIVVEEAVALLGIDVDTVIAAAPAMQQDVVLPRLAAPLPFGAGKVQALQRYLDRRTVVGAFGDNAFDIEMLSLASVPVAVRPKDRLRVRTSELPRLVELQSL